MQDWLREFLGSETKWLAIALAAFLGGLLVAGRYVKWRQRRRGSRNQKRGRLAEKRARRLLRGQGYRILESEPVFECRLFVNERWKSFRVTPDFLVEWEGEKFVVEVKTYRDQGGISNAGIRRQVLEYLFATGLPCLLVRMPEGLIDVVELEE